MTVSKLLVLLAGSCLAFWFATRTSEQYQYTVDGRIIISHDFLQNGAVHSLFVRLLEQALHYVPDADLTFDHLQQHAVWRCGSPGIDTFSDYSSNALRAVTHAIVKDKPKLTKLGKWAAHETYIGALCYQLALTKLERDRPEIFRDTEIKAMVIAGPPRTGSTHLMSMLCTHPNATCLTVVETMDPIAPMWLKPEHLLSVFDYRLWKNKLMVAVIEQLRPLSSMMQKFGATDPMEEMIMGAMFFGSIVHFASFHLPTYDKWFRETDHTEMELGVKKLLQVIQYQRGGDAKTWVLKSPQNADQLGPKSRVYPDSQFVFTHRKSFPVIQSWVGMLGYTLGVHCDPKQVNYRDFVEDLIDHQRWSQERILPEEVNKYLNSTQLLNVRFDEFMKEPIEWGLRVAKHAGLPVGADVREIFTEFQNANPQRGSKMLKYDLESFGVMPRDIENRFEKYEAAYMLQ